MGDLISVVTKFGAASIFRIFLTGLIFSLLILPVQNALVPEMLRIDELGELVTILLPEVLILGLFLPLFRNLIYRSYEGRLWWPKWLHGWLTKRIDNKVKKQLNKTKEEGIAPTHYREIWHWLRAFPINEKGDPTATRPTMLGNILEGYETYPDQRYGMDSIFYWYRLWPTLPEKFVSQADMAAASADTLMLASASSLLAGLGFAVLGGFEVFYNTYPTQQVLAFVTSLPPQGTLFRLTFFYAVLFYLFYRASLPLHRTNGEFYKAAFDLYRGNIKSITEVNAKEKELWHKTWSFLQYMFVQCKYCKKSFYSKEERCPHCNKAH